METLPTIPVATPTYITYIFGGVGVPHARSEAYNVRKLGGGGGSMAPQDLPQDLPLVIGHNSEKCASYHMMMFISCDDDQIM